MSRPFRLNCLCSHVFSTDLVGFIVLLSPAFLQYVYCYAFGWLNTMQTQYLLYGSIFTIFLCSVLVFVFSWLSTRFNRIGYIVFAALLIISSAETFYISVYHSPPSLHTFFVLSETNFLESSEYILSYANMLGWFLLYVVIQLLALLIFLKRDFRTIGMRRLRVYSLIYIFMFAISLIYSRHAYFHENIFLKLGNAFVSYRREQSRYRDLIAQSADNLQEVTRSIDYTGKETYVLIIGESTGRSHMGLYGYARQTNPGLKELGPELLVFNDVISPHTTTIRVMRVLMTFLNHEDESSETARKGTIFQCARKAGFTTYWISNQPPLGTRETFVSMMAGICDYKVFVNVNEERYEPLSYDDKVLGPLKQSLNDRHEKKLIVLHLMGTHVSYSNRYPASFERFTDRGAGRSDKVDEVVNSYDNAVLYNDYIVSQIVSLVRQDDSNAFVLYLSDHGEDVYDTADFFGHLEGPATRHMLEIPFILWLSDKYKLCNADRVAEYPSFLNRPYMTDDLLHSLCDLMNIRPDGYDPARSIFSHDFKERRRFIGDISYEEIVGRRSARHIAHLILKGLPDGIKDRIWIHRVDSIGKLREVAEAFDGVEADVIFKQPEGLFDVGHDLDESIGLTLDKYVGSIDNPQELKYWLDFKNLDSTNAAASLQRLTSLCDKYSLNKSSIMVESHNALELTPFHEAGFHTCYYLPTGVVEQLLSGSTLHESDRKAVEEMQRVYSASTVDGVSTFADGYDVVARHLPDVKEIFLFDSQMDIWQPVTAARATRILEKDKRVKVLLVKFSSQFDR